MYPETNRGRASIVPLHLLFLVLTHILAYQWHLADIGGLCEQDVAPWSKGNAAPSLLGSPYTMPQSAGALRTRGEADTELQL